MRRQCSPLQVVHKLVFSICSSWRVKWWAADGNAAQPSRRDLPSGLSLQPASLKALEVLQHLQEDSEEGRRSGEQEWRAEGEGESGIVSILPSKLSGRCFRANLRLADFVGRVRHVLLDLCIIRRGAAAEELDSPIEIGAAVALE